ncbi:transcriptional regulator GlxA family with amidase domain [Flavobacteriaceae bacterium MAR_2010_72]|nr:transcriptional regulator GlxA family with amidase domain [Flavobacteriaceae bacterium MAR_2010_72]
MEIIIYIYNGMTMLDAIGPYEILRHIEGANIKFVSKQKGEITADSHFVHLNSKYGIDEISKADILVIPGSTIAFLKEMKDDKVLNWITKINKSTQITVTVCTGSIILAATGLLKGKKATSHWKSIKLLTEFGAIPTRARVIEEGKYITAAGVSAGIDMAIYLVNKMKGEKAAKAAQLLIEYDPKPMYNSGNYLRANKEIIKMSEKLLESNVKKELSLWDLITNSRRLLKLKERQ